MTLLDCWACKQSFKRAGQKGRKPKHPLCYRCTKIYRLMRTKYSQERIMVLRNRARAYALNLIGRKLEKFKKRLTDTNEQEIFRWIDSMVNEIDLKVKERYNDPVPPKGDAFDYEDYDDKENKENIVQGNDETQASR